MSSLGKAVDASPDFVLVDVVLYSVVTRGLESRSERLVLRRTVSTEDDGSELWVEELWASAGDHASARATRQAVLSLREVARQLVLGEPITDVPGMAAPSRAALAKLGDLAGGSDGRVEILVSYRGAVRDLTVRPILSAADVCSGPGFVARVARALIVDAIAALNLRPGSSGSPPGEPNLADDDPPVTPGQVLLDDIADAQVRLEQEHLWERLATAQLANPDPPDPPMPEVTGASWVTWERQTAEGATVQAGGDIDPPLDGVVVTLIGVDGGQVGDHNEQTNLYCYRLNPQIDLRAVLAEPTVRIALAEFAASGGDPAKRDAAISALCTASTGGQSDWGEVHRVELRESGQETVSWLRGTVVISDCRGIQVGNHVRQFNTFAHVLAPRVDAGELMREHPDVVEAIVDYSVGAAGQSQHTVQQQLSAAVCAAELERDMRREEEASVRPPESEYVPEVVSSPAGIDDFAAPQIEEEIQEELPWSGGAGAAYRVIR